MIGSTEKTGACTNVERRLVALHRLAATWHPRDIGASDGLRARQQE
jgi:hypothetical protein